MNKDIINKLKNSPSRDDNELALEYIFVEFMKGNINKFWSKSILRRKFREYANNGNHFIGPIYGRDTLNVGAWFWKRYKEYLINKS